MKKIIISGIGVLALALVFAFQAPEDAQNVELRFKMPDFHMEIGSVPAKDFKVGQDGVLDFDDKRF
jgi:hypothetical protein